MDAPRARSYDLHTPDRSDRPIDVPVDLAHLRRYTLGDKALEAEILGLFLAQLPETIASLKSAETERDWKIAAHALKGSSRAVGAWRIAALAQEAETLPANVTTGACSEAIAKLEAAAAEASTFVKETACKA
jgi:HPt (histidine-containing phosphotransfer) domain-containing protein